MSVVVAYAYDDHTVLASDGRVLQGDHIETDDFPKVVEGKSWAIGGVGDVALLQKVFATVDLLKTTDLKFNDFRDVLIGIDHPPSDASFIFVGADDIEKIWVIDAEGCYLTHDMYWAIGAGAPFALGVMDVAEAPEFVEYQALVSAQRCVSVGPSSYTATINAR